MSELLVEITDGVLPMTQQPFSWSVKRQSVWILTGPLASGKTTLLKTMLGMIASKGGTFYLFGQDVNLLPPSEMLAMRKRVGVVWEEDGLIPSWSVEDNLTLLLRYHNLMPEQDIPGYLANLYEITHEESILLHQPAATLKPEQRRVVAMLRALSLDPDLLVLDSAYPAFGVQDHYARYLTCHFMRPGRAVVLHASPSAATLFPPEETQLAVILNGTVAATGTLEDLLANAPLPVSQWLRRHRYV